MQFIILHGSFGRQSENWFTWLKEELEKDGQEVLAVDFPIEDWDAMAKAGRGNWPVREQNLSKWSIHYQEHILSKIKPDEPVAFIAHSLAPLFMLSMLTENETEFDLGIFVAPFYEQMTYEDWQVEAVNYPFHEKKFDWKTIQSRLKQKHVLYSDNDPYVEADYSIDFAEKLNASAIEYKQAGHFNTAAGWTTAPLILELCRSQYTD